MVMKRHEADILGDFLRSYKLTKFLLKSRQKTAKNERRFALVFSPGPKWLVLLTTSPPEFLIGVDAKKKTDKKVRNKMVLWAGSDGDGGGGGGGDDSGGGGEGVHG